MLGFDGTGMTVPLTLCVADGDVLRENTDGEERCFFQVLKTFYGRWRGKWEGTKGADRGVLAVCDCWAVSRETMGDGDDECIVVLKSDGDEVNV